jgi:predicted metal-dependent TIM-barrel fold hydrolase
MTAAEEEALLAQLALSIEHELPVLVHTPHRDKAAGTRKTIELVEASGVPPEMMLIDHNNELTVKDVLDSGSWAGFSIYPGTKMDEHRMVRVAQEHGLDRILVNSACDWGVSDPLKVRKTADAMKEAGFDDDVIDQVVWRNPVEFFAQSGRLILDELGEADLTATFEGSGVLRGERA